MAHGVWMAHAQLQSIQMRYIEVVVRTMGDDADDNDQPTMSALSIAFHLACSTKHTK